MYSSLQAYLKRPALYERTDARFWNDPHIAKQMLAAHLDPSTDAASRNPAFIARSVDWILSLPLPQDARLLDIGCGPGLYTKRFAERGLSVTGLDLSESSIAYARGADPASIYMTGDYLAMDFSSMFDIVTLIWCDYGALIPEERSRLLSRVYRALKPGGLFLLDVFTPRYLDDAAKTASWEVRPTGGFWSADPYIVLNASYRYEDTALLHKHVIIEDDSIRTVHIWNCLFTREALQKEAVQAGFLPNGFWSDIAGAPYTDSSPTLCALFQK